VLEGNLDDFGLPDILRLLSFTGKSGRLMLRREGAVGRVDLTDGRVREASGSADRLVIARRLLGARLVTGDELAEVLQARDALPTDLELARELGDAGVVDPGTLAEVVREHTIDAVFDLLRWSEGGFRFDGSPGHQDGAVLELAVTVDELLAEAATRLEAWPSVEERTGDGSAVVTISRPPDQQVQVSLPPDGWSLLSFVDGRRTVTELALLAGEGEYRTRRTLVTLLDAGVVSIGETGGRGHVERLLADHERLAALEAGLGGATTAPLPPAPRPTPAARQAVDDDARTSWTTGPSPSADASSEGRPTPAVAQPEPVERPQPPAKENTDRHAKVLRGGRLSTDPSVDADLVRRLIDGVESL
jgi:hypothetical protein